MTFPSPSGSRTVTPVPPADPPTYVPPTTTPPPLASTLPPRPVTDKRKYKTPLGWLPWLLLGLLAALLLLALLAGRLAGDDEPASGAAGTGSQSADRGSNTTSAGTLTVAGSDLLASRADLGKLGNLDGQAAVGRGARVQSVVADEGFWVGSSAAERVFVYLTPEARKSNGESGFQVKAGQSIDLTGTVVRLGAEGAERLGVTDSEGARQLVAQRAYVSASSVRLSS